ncbi:hypothetical protein LTS14_002702 [Recurvomyces mirabilis]|nr:hypothetical protein LTS14_002702 [Recurvomyces mirabilis]
MSRFIHLSSLSCIALMSTYAFGQTSYAGGCNPLNSTCPIDPALGTTLNQTFTAASTQLNPNLWNVTAGGEAIQFGANGAELVISNPGESITAESTFYIQFGQVEVMMQAAAGQGIISTFDLLSDDLDEIDLEIMGGNTSFVESNWYGWGNTSQFNAVYHPLNGPQESLHNYTIVWTKDQLQWIIDGNVARTVPYAEPGQYPQTPSKLKFGIWAGGDSPQPGTVAWAGGKVDWTKGPFTMTVQSITITDATTNVTSYTYGDTTGSYQSITSTPGISAASKLANKVSAAQSAQKQWNGLSQTAKIAIGCSVVGVLLIVVVAYTAICVVQRKKGRLERQRADREWDEQQNELLAYRSRMAKGGFAVSHMGHGEKF